MSAWLSISLADLNDYLVGAQVTALNSTRWRRARRTVLRRIMTDMVNRIAPRSRAPRNYISATPLAVPPELKWVACYLIIEGDAGGVPRFEIGPMTSAAKLRKQ